MDEQVKAAMAKWPRVPHCYGWLALDARGDWYMRDDRIQAAGPFPQVKGSRIEHQKLREFIDRNYDCDEQGAWYFQNGPQRVYVQVEAAPFVWRVDQHAEHAGSGPAPSSWSVSAHTGLQAQVQGAYLCEQGRLFLHCDLGLGLGLVMGLVHSLDMGIAAEAVLAGHWQPQDLSWAEMPRRFGFVLNPQPVALA